MTKQYTIFLSTIPAMAQVTITFKDDQHPSLPSVQSIWVAVPAKESLTAAKGPNVTFISSDCCYIGSFFRSAKGISC